MRRKPPGISLCLILAAFLPMAGRSQDSNTTDFPKNILPITTRSGPGPTVLSGSETSPEGTQFISVNLTIDGPGDFRVYFDYRNPHNFHFMERRGSNISLGVCETGLEQMMETATDGGGAWRLTRHGIRIGLFQGGKLIASTLDDCMVGGAAGFRMLANSASISFKAEPCEDIHFSDDFMIDENKGAQWHGNGNAERGDFSVKSLRYSALSVNAFNFMGAGRNIYSVVGEPWWDQYCFEAALRGPQNSRIGLVFAFQDGRNYGLFRWSARKNDSSGKNPSGVRELVRVREGREEILASAPGGYAADQWYSALIRVMYSGVRIEIDGHPILEAVDPSLASGGAGVWCDVPLPGDPDGRKDQSFKLNSLNSLMRRHAVFDDVRISACQEFEDDFVLAGPLRGGWMTGLGSWEIENKTGMRTSAELRVIPGNETAKALIGSRGWSQYEIEAMARVDKNAAGIIFLHRDEGNYYCATADENTLRLIRVADGRETIADTAPIPKEGGAIHLLVSVKHGHIHVSANGVISVEAFDNDQMLMGRVGLVCYPAPGGAGHGVHFSHFKVSFPIERQALATNTIFESESTMSGWAGASSDWYPPKEQVLVDGRPGTLLWHRGQFPGDVELAAEPSELTEPNSQIALSISKLGQGKDNGYVFRYKTAGQSAIDSPAGRSMLLQLTRQGDMVAEKTIQSGANQLHSLSIRRCGKYVIGLINGIPAISYHDDNPLPGSKVAYLTQGATVPVAATRIVSDHFKNDLFSYAPTGWRLAGPAIAEVTNRWQCNPRWSFFSLKNDREAGKPAVLWSKYLYPGDVTIEFYVSNKMEEERGEPYSYARDINVTLCSDGADLTKGYTCMFGGQNNSGSMIFRNGEQVRHSSARIPTTKRVGATNYHRHWFAIRAEKRGHTVSFRVDRYFENEKEGELVYEDAQPLTGDRMAIWTCDHAIMLSRIRISGQGGELREDPGWEPGPLKTHYDAK